MDKQRFVVMGAGEVGFHLARSMSHDGHDVVVIDLDPNRIERIDEQLDVLAVLGDGCHASALRKASASQADLFLAVSSSDSANLAAARLARHFGAERCVVRVGAAGQVMRYRDTYSEVFGIDLLLSTQELTTSRILNRIRGHNTVAIESYAAGKVQLRKIHLERGSSLTGKALADLDLPADLLVVALFRGEELIIPSGEDVAMPGDEALILGKVDSLERFERTVAGKTEDLGLVIIGGAGQTGSTVARALQGLRVEVKIIEQNREKARRLAAEFPRFEVLHGDMTDLNLFKAERLDRARTFVALSGHDDTNLMADLLAKELGIPQVLALVQRTETSHLFRRLGLPEVLSPRQLAYQRIREYIESGYNANIVSLGRGKAQVLERRLVSASPAAGVTLSEMSPPRGLIVAAVQRGDKVFVPDGEDRLEVGDLVILFVAEDEIATMQLLFPGRDLT